MVPEVFTFLLPAPAGYDPTTTVTPTPGVATELDIYGAWGFDDLQAPRWAACSHRHLLRSISLKGDTGANQKGRREACCTGHPRESVVCWRSGR